MASAAELSPDEPRGAPGGPKICQQTHWERGGHDALCKKIKKGGGAEQYHADQKYKEAVAEAVDACAEDTKGHDSRCCF